MLGLSDYVCPDGELQEWDVALELSQQIWVGNGDLGVSHR